MKKVLLIHNILWSHYKAGVFTELNHLLASDGYDFLVVHISPKGNAQKNHGDVDLDMHQYPFKVLFEEDYEELGNLRKSASVCKKIISYKPDILILPGYNEIFCWFALISAKLLMIHIIISCDSTAMDRPRFWYKEALKKFFVRRCSVGFCYGIKSAEYLNTLGMPTTDIFLRCQAINNEEIAAIHESVHAVRKEFLTATGFKQHNFIFVGRLNPIKNIEHLIKAFAILKNTNALALSWGLIVVGDGPQKEELISICTELKVCDVYFVGGKSWREVPKFHALADVLVLPSISEPWGLVINEAMACSMPVLVSKYCGAAYDLVYVGENGFIFDPFDKEELINWLNYFVTHHKRIEKMGMRSREIISGYSSKNAAKQMYNGIDRLLNHRIKH